MTLIRRCVTTRARASTTSSVSNFTTYHNPDSNLIADQAQSFSQAKAAKGEILVYFNELFDATAKVRGAERVFDRGGVRQLTSLLLDRWPARGRRGPSSQERGRPTRQVNKGYSNGPGSDVRLYDVSLSRLRPSFHLRHSRPSRPARARLLARALHPAPARAHYRHQPLHAQLPRRVAYHPRLGARARSGRAPARLP